jgi:hypothetical protein
MFYAIAAYYLTRWFLAGSPRMDFDNGWILSRWETAKHIWTLNSGRACMKMRHYWTIEEVIERCDERKATA